MKPLTNDIRERLLKNGHILTAFSEEGKSEPDFLPVVKLFTPDSQCTWLLTELDPHEPDIAFGLCDLGMGFPELGSVRISKLESGRGRLNLPVERDYHFMPTQTISAYADEARQCGNIKA